MSIFRRTFLFIILDCILVRSQLLQTNVADLFYYTNFKGPVFDQLVYRDTSVNFSIASPINTTVLTFSVKASTEYTIPSYVPTARSLNTVDNIIITLNEPTFFVQQLSNFTYRLANAISPLNYLLPFHRYAFTLTATQLFSGRPSVSSTATVQINLGYCNMYTPTFVNLNPTFIVTTALSAGVQFGTMFATDGDKDDVIFSLSPSSQFVIDRSTGVLTMTQPFSSATAAGSTTLSVTVTDVPTSSCASPCSTCSARSSTTTITISVTTANTEPPRFLNQPCGLTFSLPESSPTGTNITTFTVMDVDQGLNSQIVFSFPLDELQTVLAVGTNTGQSKETFYSKFQLNPSNQIGNIRIVQLQTNQTFDYDQAGATRNWQLFILASDQGTPPLQSVCTVRITLSEVNDFAPVFISTFWNQTIYAATGSTILRVVASDLDYGQSGVINYYISGSTQGYFTIDRSTGIISFIAGVTYSNVDTTLFPMTFTVFAQDLGTPPLKSSVNATVMLYLAASGTLPTVQWTNPSTGQLSATISEKYFETYGSQPITDAQNGFDGSISYRSNTQSPYLFYVGNPFSGSSLPFREASTTVNNFVFTSGITVTGGLDAEIQSSYLLSLRVADTPPMRGWASINLRDENDESPRFSVRSMDLNIRGNIATTQTIGRFLAYDNDLTAPNNVIQYSINTVLTDSITRSRFFLTSGGTLTTNTSFNRQDQSTYRVVITAADSALGWGKSTSNSEDFQLNINIVDNSNLAPVFGQTNANISISENTATSTSIFNITVTDTDPYSQLTYGISSGNSKSVFTFVEDSNNLNDLTRVQYQATAKVNLVGPLNYLDQQTYNLQLFAFDGNNLATFTLIVNVVSSYGSMPFFLYQPVPYEYYIRERTATSVLNTNQIVANNTNPSSYPLVFSIQSDDQRILQTVYLNQSNNQVSIGVASPGLVRDEPYGSSKYSFGLCVTDKNGTGVSSCEPVTINAVDINNNAPIPISTSGQTWTMSEGTPNPTLSLTFQDFDDGLMNNTFPFFVRVVDPLTFSLTPTVSSSATFVLTYNGTLSRKDTKNITVTIVTQDLKHFTTNISIPIIVGDTAGDDAISDGSKTINAIYPQGYQNSLTNTDLGSVYVVNVDDVYTAKNTYGISSSTNNIPFLVSTDGLLSTSSSLSSGSYSVVVQVTKAITSGQSSAKSYISLQVSDIKLEAIREAITVRIQGETAESLLDPSFGDRLQQLKTAVASILSVSTDSIRLLTLRNVPQYRPTIYPPLPFDVAKQQALTDVIFSVSSTTKTAAENTLNNRLSQLSSSSGLAATVIGPNPCRNYYCPLGTYCRVSRSIQPFPLLVDTSLLSFVGINIVDSPDCVNSTWVASSQASLQTGCSTSSFNDAVTCPCTSFQSLAPLGPYCEVLGRSFGSGGGSYAVYDGATFANIAPSRFSFEFAVSDTSTFGVLVLYGRDVPPIDDYLWFAVELVSSNKLRFHLRGTGSFDTNLAIAASTWYHVEYQYVSDTMLIQVNNEQYGIIITNNTINNYNRSSVRLYVGGLPTLNSAITALYPTLTNLDTFRGCIRNVQSSGVYVDLNRPLSASTNSLSGSCSCSLTNICDTVTATGDTGVIVPWYVWLIIGLVFLVLIGIITLIYCACCYGKKRRKAPQQVYFKDADNRTEDDSYRDRSGEEDTVSYNLGILRKPIYTVSNDEIWREHVDDMSDHGFMDPATKASLGNFIDQRLSQHPITPRFTDTMLYYANEGDGSLASDLSSIVYDEV